MNDVKTRYRIAFQAITDPSGIFHTEWKDDIEMLIDALTKWRRDCADAIHGIEAEDGREIEPQYIMNP
jgi:hypothetical protein